ncbi:unknown [[Mannheimia] succiniciproducens MBEL55E]|uniref:Uncharacterized protein n=1 Tax=Mannheimia succiniciproducens (strain KCTC 0769BP / MBEL55E) TaxID=221988 RepID=Q65RA5_MANSM|nr:unknown [[Mannheimia] succiniciproducens MBEL55E]
MVSVYFLSKRFLLIKTTTPRLTRGVENYGQFKNPVNYTALLTQI